MDKIEFDYEKYPDGISETLNFLDHEELVWNRGYFCEVEDGCWYELYVNDSVKVTFPALNGDINDENAVIYAFRGFKGLWLGDYEENNQITFFEPKNENIWRYEEMTDIFL